MNSFFLSEFLSRWVSFSLRFLKYKWWGLLGRSSILFNMTEHVALATLLWFSLFLFFLSLSLLFSGIFPYSLWSLIIIPVFSLLICFIHLVPHLMLAQDEIFRFRFLPIRSFSLPLSLSLTYLYRLNFLYLSPDWGGGPQRNEEMQNRAEKKVSEKYIHQSSFCIHSFSSQKEREREKERRRRLNEVVSFHSFQVG